KYVTQQLENEGIQKFIEAYNTLIEGLETKRLKALGDYMPTQKIVFADLNVKPIYHSLDELQFGKRLFKQDSWNKQNKLNASGPYSILSDFQLIPMALTEGDIEALLQSAQRMQISCDSSLPA